MMNTEHKTRRILRFALISLSLIFIVFSLLSHNTVSASEHSQSVKLLYAGGVPFGVKFFSKGVIIAGFCDVQASAEAEKNPALSAGLKINDVILSVNGSEPESCEDFLKMIEGSGGESLTIRYSRRNEERSTSLRPVFSDEEGKYKCGMYIRQGGAGIGTVTYIDPDTLSFGGLGHGICDAQSGMVLPISHGIVMDVRISGIVKGKIGTPGELKGAFTSPRTGFVRSNTDCGVFGVFTALPRNVSLTKYPICTRSDLSEGKAYILCSLDGDGAPQKYEIEISSVRRESRDNKSFSIKVTDPVLIAKTGGIVQGMSGSPIIQNGKLVGAVTHVMISDPTIGYGIFIENMLEAAG